MTSFVNGFEVRLCADSQGIATCRIFLPPQSLLGIYEGLRYRPTGMWPASFLCLRHGRSFLRGSDDVHPGIEYSPIPHLYEVEAGCGQENCERQHTLFAAREASSTDARDRVLGNKPAIVCNGHDLLWTDNQVKVTQIHPSLL